MTNKVPRDQAAELARRIWDHLVENYHPRSTLARTTFPEVRFARKTRRVKWPSGYTHLRLGTGVLDRYVVLVRLSRSPSLNTRALVHELFHARGYSHGRIKGLRFAHDITKDRASQQVMKELGLPWLERK